MSTSPENGPQPMPLPADGAPTAAIVYPPVPAESAPAATHGSNHTRTIIEVVVGAAAVMAILVAGVAGFAVGYAVTSHDDRRDVAGGFAMGRIWEQRGDSPFGGNNFGGQDFGGQSGRDTPFGWGDQDGPGWGRMMPGTPGQGMQPGQPSVPDGTAPGGTPSLPTPAG